MGDERRNSYPSYLEVARVGGLGRKGEGVEVYEMKLFTYTHKPEEYVDVVCL